LGDVEFLDYCFCGDGEVAAVDVCEKGVEADGEVCC
jgi:hypothetical protein